MTNKNYHRKELRIPKNLLEPIRYALESRATNVNFDDALAVLGVTREEYEPGDFAIDGNQYLALHRWLRKHTYGRIPMKDWLNYYTVTSAGLAGMAALSAATVRDALMIPHHFLPLIVPGMRATLQEGPVTTRMVMEMEADFEEMNQFLLEVVTAIINAICEDAMGGSNDRTVHFMHDCGVDHRGRSRQPYFDELFLGYPVYFNSDFNGMAGESKNLELKTSRPNVATYQTALQILQKQLAEHETQSAFQSMVRKKLIELLDNNQHLSLEEFADTLHMSPRTLIRKLAQDDTSYKQISNEVRLQRSKDLLAGSSLSIKQIAARTGFTNANSFSRAFKALVGETPLEWRKNNPRQ